MGLTMSQRQAVTKAIATRYRRAGRAEKGAYAFVFATTVSQLLAEPETIAEDSEEAERRLHDWRRLIETHGDFLILMKTQRATAADRLAEVTMGSGGTAKNFWAHLSKADPLAEHDKELLAVSQTSRERSHGKPRKKT
jgi:hypothetical protein